MTVSDRTRIRTHPERAVPDEAEEILEKSLVAHVGFIADGLPVVIPMLYHYENNTVYVHGQRGGRLPRTLRAGETVCVEVTILDGLIASRHALYHSANYRSAVGFGKAREVTDRDEKEAVLERMTRRYFPGRIVGEHYSPPTDGDLKITALMAIDLDELNGKKRSGPPAGPDDADDSPDAFGTRGIVPVSPTGEVGTIE
ncbi:MAG: pyridoxamine 5'-phosphate oxidase family protein [Chloroflexi bacterium]|nr:pyridoxamine 5'-phosphate oxidase family protein [Chloroflexota bacterium]